MQGRRREHGRSAHRVAVALVVAGLGLAAAPASVGAAGRAHRAVAPTSKTWDPRIVKIAADVERLRGLKFEHPVPVRFLSDAAFAKQQRIDASKLTKAQKAKLQQSQSVLRSLGLIGSDVDLLKASNDLQSSDVLAYYDPATKRVTVRGDQAIDVATRVTLAHELTHALQDQHFDLIRIEREAQRTHSGTVSRAIVEGDALRVQDLYEQQLSSDDRSAYAATAKAQTQNAKSAIAAQNVPDALVVLFQAPYDFGPLLMTIAQARLSGGVNGLFAHPPTRDADLLTPSALVEHAAFVSVKPPALGKGERRVGAPDVFGAYDLYIVLATRIGGSDALRAADGWGGDAMVTFTRKGASGRTETCVRAAFAGRTAAATGAIDQALTAWSAAMPAGTTSLAEQGGQVLFTACDTGAAVPAPAHSAVEAETLAAERDALYGALLKEGAPSPQASCAADALVRDPVFAPFLADPSATPSASQLADVRSRAAVIAQQCRTGH